MSISDLKSTILIVDDLTDNIQLIAKILKADDYHIGYAISGKRALELVEGHKYDLILLDIMMPGMNGYDVCKILKSNDKTKNIPVIFLTARAESENVIRGFEAGAQDYITKPFNRKELLARIKTHLDLKRHRDKLEEMNDMKNKLFSIISHDLRGPLGGLIGLSKYLFEDFDTIETKKVKQFLKLIYESSKESYDLLENLLYWAQSETGRIKYSPEKYDIVHIVKEVLIPLYKIAENKNIELNVDTLGPITAVFDKNMISFVVRNLVTNAIKFTNPGGNVTITVEDYSSSNIRVKVTDTGIGMQKSKVNSILNNDRFLSTQGTAKEKGSGLGLILCKEFCRKNKGFIDIESFPGQGSSFKFTLPKYD